MHRWVSLWESVALGVAGNIVQPKWPRFADEHADGRVLSIHELGCAGHDAPQDDWKAEIGGDRRHRIEKATNLGAARHRWQCTGA